MTTTPKTAAGGAGKVGATTKPRYVHGEMDSGDPFGGYEGRPGDTILGPTITGNTGASGNRAIGQRVGGGKTEEIFVGQQGETVSILTAGRTGGEVVPISESYSIRAARYKKLLPGHEVVKATSPKGKPATYTGKPEWQQILDPNDPMLKSYLEGGIGGGDKLEKLYTKALNSGKPHDIEKFARKSGLKVVSGGGRHGTHIVTPGGQLVEPLPSHSTIGKGLTKKILDSVRAASQ